MLDEPAPRSACVGLGIVSAALVASELSLTRVFSVVVWYHFAFFAISVALFGLGVAALGVHFFRHRLPPERVARQLSLGALALTASLVVLVLSLLHVTPDWFGGAAGAFTAPTAKLGAVFVLAAAPFVCGGFVVALTMSRWPLSAHRLYFWDLVGAGLGCALVAPLMSLCGGPLAIVVLAALSAAAVFAFAADGTARSLRRPALLAIAVLAVLGGTSGATGAFEVRVAKGIALDKVQPELTRWNAFSMVSVLPHAGFRGWGLSPAYNGPIPEQKTLVIDMNAMTPLTRFDGKLSDVVHTTYDLSAFVYRIRQGAPKVCVVGAGGGKDVLAALVSGAGHVTAVEVNPLIARDVMQGAYREFTGGLYLRPDVDAVVADGRSYVQSSGRRWNIVHLSMVDTSAASAAGAYALTENGLYTVDAVRAFTDALEPGGVFSVASVSLPDLAVGARLSSIVRAALAGRGVTAADSVAVLKTPWLGVKEAAMYLVLAAPGGFDRATVDAIIAHAAALRFDVVYAPGRAATTASVEDGWVREILSAKDDAALSRTLDALPLDVSPATDDRPFFFYQNRLRDLGVALRSNTPTHLFGNGLVIVAKVLVVSATMVAVFLLLPFFVRREQAGVKRGTASSLALMGALGLGFMLVEIGLLHRLGPYLGDPTRALTVVLLVLLVCGGLGSRLAARRGSGPRRLVVALGLALLVVGAVVALSPWALDATRALSATPRALIAALWVAPVGLALGMPLPALLSDVARQAPERVPWLWAINGACSVLGSVFATLIALNLGIRATLGLGALIYGVAGLVALVRLRADDRLAAP